MGDENKIRDAADAIAGIAKAVPVYQDVAQPAAQEVGRALQTVAKTVHIALAPVSALVWGYDQIREFVATKVSERLKTVPPENIVPPKPNVAGPALEALRYTGHEGSLSDLYANLLASSMNKDTAQGAHPAFVDIIKQLTSDEAKLLKLFSLNRPLALISLGIQMSGQQGMRNVVEHYSTLGQEAGCEFPDMTPSYINNLCRLGIAEVPEFDHYTAQEVYDPLESSSFIAGLKQQIEAAPNQKAKITKKMVRITALGKQFMRTCLSASDS
ncbi:DUF4393 domain-containing protein [Dyella sp.]|uniref:DUF4393 domain-containing protein n=1 Tax=Dyella sp. TaxID=1869338 RepID=UPI002D7A3C20|nr:DUF4393 domain-containing protein [Dyella sp.]HET6432358.1 DUF4393 domain-containing protein [Dyella sp.]